jgi:hypothetical protein
LEHCVRLFSEENSRREKFDKTAQYYLAFETAFIAALFLKVDFLQTLSTLLIAKPVPVVVVRIIYSSIVIMLLSLLMALICILECIRVRRYKREFPRNPALSLFGTESFYAGGQREASFLRVTSLSYIAAIEANFHITERKGLWIERASYFILASVLSLFTLLAAITYLIIR